MLGLARWSVLSALLPKEEEGKRTRVFARLHLALMHSIMEIKVGKGPVCYVLLIHRNNRSTSFIH